MVRLQMEEEEASASIIGEVDRKQQPTATRAAWMFKEIWKLVDWREAVQRSGQASMREVCKVQCNFQGALHEDRQQRVQTAVCNIDFLMEEGRFKEAWDHITR